MSQPLANEPSAPPRRGLHLLARIVLPALVAVLFALHFVHLRADFPNFSPWMDWSKYTDEGWYGDAAIRHFQLGRWYVAGDFNPAAALPVWPLVEAALFRFTGVSLLAARVLVVAVFGCSVLAAWALISRWQPARPDGSRPLSLAGPAAALLLVSSPFCFVFTRLAILEPPLVLWMLLALLAAGAVRAVPPGRGRVWWLLAFRANLLPALALGVLLPTMILTKTTALFLFPAVAFLLWAACGYRLRLFFAIGVPAGVLAAVLWLGYFGLLVRPHYLLDYRYLFSANAYTGITRARFFTVLYDTVHGGGWIGRGLYGAALACAAWACIRVRTLRDAPLVATLLLWAGGYMAFLAYHDNLQPRYYLVVAVPLIMLVPVTLEQLVLPLFRDTRSHQAALAVAGVVVAALAVPGTKDTLSYVRHPEYTLWDAAWAVHNYIAQDRLKDPTHNPLLLSISASDIALMTGVPAICDDFGTLELGDRVAKYRPGWYAAWNQIDDDKMDAVSPLFHVERVAAFPAMDDPDRNLLILYKLEPSPPTPPPTRGKRKPLPRRLRTRVGQQPSEEQLQH